MFQAHRIASRSVDAIQLCRSSPLSIILLVLANTNAIAQVDFTNEAIPTMVFAPMVFITSDGAPRNQLVPFKLPPLTYGPFEIIVETVVAIVTHHEEFARWYGHRGHHFPGMFIDYAEVVAWIFHVNRRSILIRHLEVRVRIVDRTAVEENPAILHHHGVARNSDDPLD